MSDFTPAPSTAAPAGQPAPAGAAPDAGGAPAPVTTPEADAPLHESWQRALNDAAVPEMMRPVLIEQIRRSEREHNQAIERANAQRAPEAWAPLIQQAQQNQVDPQALADAYNAGMQIRADPFSFIDSYVAQVNDMVTAGQLSAPAGWAARYQAALQQGATQQQASDFADQSGVTNPEDDRIARLEQALAAQEEARQQEALAAQEADEDAAAEAYAEQYMTTLHGALTTAGFAGADGAVSPAVVQLVGAAAAQMIDATGGQMDVNTAINQATQQYVAQIQSYGGRVAAAAPAAQQQLPPVGGGSAALAAPSRGFASDQARLDAMLQAGRAALGG